jgi:DNA-binding response OmpR family regulator
LIERYRPRVIAVDWDLPEIDSAVICNVGQRLAPTGILAIMQSPERAPAAIKAGCHSILLKPLTPNLVAARLGRLCREMPTAMPAARPGTRRQWGTNRTWSHLHCPTCNESGAIGFEHSSHRRSWYACLACDHVWLGPRRE